MNFCREEIQRDIFEMNEKLFLIKYILRSDNWYFSKYLEMSDAEVLKAVDTFKEIISEGLHVSFHNITMVGSGKIGYSLAPTNKLFREFVSEANAGQKESDIDIAIISDFYFNYLWKLFRENYSMKYQHNYISLTSSIFRGFINQNDFSIIDEVRGEWESKIVKTRKKLQQQLHIQHDINFRIYRSWEDLEDYHLNGIMKIKQGLIRR